MVYKLTFDGGLLGQSVLLPSVSALKTWESEGRLEIFEADRAKQAPAQTTGWSGGLRSGQDLRSKVGTTQKSFWKKNSASGTMFVRVSAVLFPNRDERKLSMTEINGVVHLLGHQSSGHDVFVTSNTSDFIDGGKRERLKSVLNVVVMSPEETVVWLCKTQGWENPEGQTKSVQPRGKRGGH